MDIQRYNRILSNFVFSPKWRFLYLARTGFYDHMPDEEFLKRKYKYIIGTELNLDNPRTFNEKLQWLKLHDHNPVYTVMVDKYLAKEYVANIIGNEYIIPTLGVWSSPDEIDFDSLPEQFVLKCNHNSGTGMCICTDKNELDIQKVKKGLRKGMAENYYLNGREWPYKDVPRKIIAEKYLVDESGKELKDYKVFNFNGEPKLIQVDYDRFVGHKRNLYTIDWKYIEASIEYPTDKSRQIPKPEALDKMLSLATELSKGFPHVRTDFYSIEDKIYFGELTFYHESGYGVFTPPSFGEQMGEWLRLPSGGVMLKYKNIRILVKMAADDSVPGELLDYKFMCFNGEVKCSFVCSERRSGNGLKVTFYDRDWNIMPFERHYPRSQVAVEKPCNYQKMIELAEKLSKGFPFIRVDFYEVNGRVYFGELTLYPGSGFEEFIPQEWDETLGSWLSLP